MQSTAFLAKHLLPALGVQGKQGGCRASVFAIGKKEPPGKKLLRSGHPLPGEITNLIW
jgi:hypothetical protein